MKKSLSRIDYSKSFDKQLKKAPLSIKIAFRQRLELFIADQFHPQLNNHTLIGKYKGYRSINITGDWRAIYSEDKNVVIFELLGTHSQLYK
ncbi:type II toxin-antitoxin system mRNA interferase toxin, RelE/StbE family [Patescibacteria group bacterium]|nr:type II toxin-antitoxin system mRNA interferase toxin, RelE/StbE family [Patescibacteria group bacterium]